MIESTFCEMKFSTWLSWAAVSSLASVMLTVTPLASASALMPSWTRLRNVSLFGKATPMV
jgi:hypothetical protein